MPRLRRRIAGGHLRPMKASLPEISSVSWSSFMTGTGPGEHGIFGFTELDPETYELRFPGFHDLRIPTFWDRLGRHGYRCVVLNQPSTYPARAIPGSLVSGFVAADLVRGVKPLRHLGPLRRFSYRIDIDTQRARRDHAYLLDDLRETLELRERALTYLWDDEPWDYLQVVVTGTDRLYHYLWDALDDDSHPHHDAVLDYHARVDRFVERVLERFERASDGRGSAWLLSDHGFCGIVQEVQLNAWLRHHGYLELNEVGDDTAEGSLRHEQISPSTRAFALDPGRIYIHRRGRFARGGVGPEEARTLKREIAAGLQELQYEDREVMRQVFDAREIYRGPAVDDGPDLVALSRPGFDLKASLTTDDVFEGSELRGMHTWDDAFLLSPAPLEGDLWIGDLAGALLAELDIESHPGATGEGP